MDKEKYELTLKAFNDYYEQYKDLSKGIKLKYNHSFNVADYMYELADRLLLSEEDKYLAKTIGLLHDLGRFEQLKQFDSYDDKLLDHADYACTYLFDQGHIRDFIKEEKYDDIINKAIKNHNKYEIEEGLNERELFFAKMIRDMDKVDVLYQTAIKLRAVFMDEPSKEVLEELYDGKPIDRRLVNNKSDITILTLGFVNDINFDDSFDILRESDNLGLYVSVAEVAPEQEETFRKIVEYCNKKLGVGVCD